MPQSNFDSYKDNYRQTVQDAISFLGQPVDFFTEVKVLCLVDVIRRLVGDPAKAKVLDVGCGVGQTDRFLVPLIGSLWGVDVAAQSVEKAARMNPAVNYVAYEGDRLPFEDGFFDVTVAINVMHHVPPFQWDSFAAEMYRVLRTGGIAVVFEHNPWNPLTRWAVYRCAFDEDAVLLTRRATRRLLSRAGLRIAEKQYLLFFPWQHRVFRRVEKGLGWLPLGAQYYVAGKKE